MSHTLAEALSRVSPGAQAHQLPFPIAVHLEFTVGGKEQPGKSVAVGMRCALCVYMSEGGMGWVQ